MRHAPFVLGWTLSACLGIAEVDDRSGPSDGGGGSDGAAAGSGWPDSGSGGVAGASTGGAAGGGATSSGATGGAGATGGSGGTTGGTLTIKPGLSTSGDGFLASPDLCNQTVFDSYKQPSYKAIHVGRDVPCGAIATYRAYVRFDLSPLAGKSAKSAKLRFYYAENTDATAGVALRYIDDFGQLDFGDWPIAERMTFGSVFDASTAPGWVERDVTAAVQDVQSKSETVVAFQLRYLDETQDPGGTSRWYGIVATEDPSDQGPQLLVDY